MLQLRALRRWDRFRLDRVTARHPGLSIDPAASTNLASARFVLAPGARVSIGPGVVTERIPGALRLLVEEGAQVEIGARVWLRTELGPVVLVAFAGARLRIGDDAFLNAAHVSAKRSVTLGRRAWVGPGSRIFDADQHDFDADTPERVAPVSVGDHVWIASGVTVLRGVTIGEHAVVGAHSLVTHDVPAHGVAYGVPAELRGRTGDRSTTR